MNEYPNMDQRTEEVPTSRLIDWFAVGQGCAVEVGGAVIQLHVVGQKGRRTRIAVSASAQATFTTHSNPRWKADELSRPVSSSLHSDRPSGSPSSTTASQGT
jgi:hypothetical protein